LLINPMNQADHIIKAGKKIFIRIIS